MKWKLPPRKATLINPKKWHEKFVILSWTDDGQIVFWDWIWRREVPARFSYDYGVTFVPGWKWERRAEKPDNLMAQGGH